MKNNTMKYFTFLFYGIVACALIFFVEYTIVNDPRRIVFEDSKLYINPGETLKVPYRTTLTAANKQDIKWSSSNPDVVSVSENGLLRGYKEGSAKVIVQIKEGKKTQKASVEVHTTKNTISVQKVKVSKETLILNKGDSYLLKALISPSNATNQKVYFTSSDPSVVLVDSSGHVQALKAGRASITILTDDGKFKDTCQIVVAKKEEPVTHIALGEEENTLYVGDDFTIKASVYPSNATNKSLMYQSSDVSIASVDEYGNVVGKRPGEVDITATSSSGMHQARMKVGVKERETLKEEVTEVAKVKLSITDIELKEGETEKVEVTLEPQNVTHPEMVFRSSNEDVVTVSEEGIMKAISRGKATIVATATNGMNASVKVTVKEKKIPLRTLSLLETRYEIQKGESFELPLVLSPDNTTEKEFIYTVQNPKVVSVQKGIVKGLKEGKTMITVRSETGKKVVCTVEVIDKEEEALEKIEIEPYITMHKGELYTLVSKMIPTSNSLSYYSSNEKVATVDDNGHITAQGEGYSTITVLSLNGKRATTKVLVKQEKILPKKIELTKDEYKCFIGDSLVLKYKVLPKETSENSVTFTSSDSSIASVTSEGKVLAKKDGRAVIHLRTSNGKVATAVINVSPKAIPIEKVVLEGKKITLDMGEYRNVKTNILPLNATEQSLQYTSSDEEVATVSSSGRVTAHKEGKTIITVTSMNGKKDTMTVSVKEKDIPVTGISFDKEVLYMSIGATQMAPLSVAPSNATNKNVKYKSFDTSLLQVDEKGIMKALKEGTVFLEATSQNGKKTRMKVVITKEKIYPQNILFANSTLTLGVGRKAKIEVELSPNTSNETSLLYEVSDTSIAEVDEKGIIRGHKPGITEVIATTENGKVARMAIEVVEYMSKIHFNAATLLESNGRYGLLMPTETSFNSDTLAFYREKGIQTLSFVVLPNPSRESFDDIEALYKEHFLSNDSTLYYTNLEETSLYKKEIDSLKKRNVRVVDVKEELHLSLGDFSLTLYPILKGTQSSLTTLVTRGTKKVLLDYRENADYLEKKIGKVDALKWGSDILSSETLDTLCPTYAFFAGSEDLATSRKGELFSLQSKGSKIYKVEDRTDAVTTLYEKSLSVEGDTYKEIPKDGWYDWKGSGYYYFESGMPLIGWQTLKMNQSEDDYYFDTKGKMRTGLLYLPWSGGEDWFYLNPKTGKKSMGLQKITEKKESIYSYFDESGVRVSDTCILEENKKICLDKKGVCTEGCE